jgi:hypothetical protein
MAWFNRIPGRPYPPGEDPRDSYPGGIDKAPLEELCQLSNLALISEATRLLTDFFPSCEEEKTRFREILSILKLRETTARRMGYRNSRKTRRRPMSRLRSRSELAQEAVGWLTIRLETTRDLACLIVLLEQAGHPYLASALEFDCLDQASDSLEIKEALKANLQKQIDWLRKRPLQRAREIIPDYEYLKPPFHRDDDDDEEEPKGLVLLPDHTT